MDGAMRILLVDNDRWIRDIFRQTLTGSGHEVITAAGGEEALDILSKNAVDIMFFDLGMPVTGGKTP
jgi:CheY-like chemotaxis protein